MTVSELQEQIDQLKHQLAELEHQVAAHDGGETMSTRRGVFKKLAVGAVGAVAASGAVSALTARPAAATDGVDLNIGNDTQTSQSLTALIYSPATATTGVFTAADSAINIGSSTYPAALNGWAYGRVANGVYGFSFVDNGAGVVGWAQTPGGNGVVARSDVGSNLVLHSQGLAPTARPGAFVKGSVVGDANGDVWLCIVAGTPGTWRKIGGPATSGALHVLPEPLRSYDSRSGAKLAAGSTTTVPLANGKNGLNVSVAAVPAGATAALVNVTLTGTVGGFGFLQAYSAALAAPPATSVMNWSSANDSVANEMTIAVDSAPAIKLTVGANDTHIIVDVVGYYR
jgi:hypothetical protein